MEFDTKKYLVPGLMVVLGLILCFVAPGGVSLLPMGIVLLLGGGLLIFLRAGGIARKELGGDKTNLTRGSRLQTKSSPVVDNDDF